jgi:hypothetical protein
MACGIAVFRHSSGAASLVTGNAFSSAIAVGTNVGTSAVLLPSPLSRADLGCIPIAVTDAGLARLSSLDELRTLTLQVTKVTDAGLVHLASLHKLRDLNLCHTQITDAGLERLGPLHELRRLGLSETPVTEAGKNAFAASHPECRVF